MKNVGPMSDVPVSANVEVSASPAKHTPGPWLVDHTHANMFPFIYKEGLGTIAEVFCDKFSRPGFEQEAEANARLIAAAPTMLEALKALPLEAFDKDMDACDAAEFVDNAGDFFEAMQKARAAIAKAESTGLATEAAGGTGSANPEGS